MSKVRETWAFQEVVASAKLNQANTDWITTGLLVCSADNFTKVYHANVAINAVITLTNFGLGVYPYNPAKSVYDEMRIIWNTNAGATGGGGGAVATAPGVEYTLNGGGAWIPVVSDFAFPVLGHASPCTGTTDNSNGYDLVDISLVAGFQWLSWRLTGGSATTTNPANDDQACMSWQVSVFLNSSADTPF